MSAEKEMILRAMPDMIQAEVLDYLRDEVQKGCNSRAFPFPVALEPPYSPLCNQNKLPNRAPYADIIAEEIPQIDDLLRLQVWLSPYEEFVWLNAELFLKQLSGISHRIGFEITGNKENIHIGFLVHKDDLAVLETSCLGIFNKCELSQVSTFRPFEEIGEPGMKVSFIDIFPPPPYSHLMTRPDELKVSPYQSLFAALMAIEPPEWGFYQALFQPVHPGHNWHRNIEILLDMEYVCKLMNSGQALQRYSQQAPSGDLRQMSRDVETKSHNDKPFFSLTCRLGSVSKTSPSPYVKSISTFFNLFQHGGRPMEHISDGDYQPLLSNDEIKTMFLLGLTYRPGFLVNSSELSGPVHIPKADILEFRKPKIGVLSTLPAQNTDIHEGTPLGTYEYAGKKYAVCIPLKLRTRSTHMIGKPGLGKTNEMAHMILNDIVRGIGVAVIDPHGDLIEALIRCILEKYIQKTVYFDLGLPNQVPIWNPLKITKGQDISRITNDLVSVIKTVFIAGWGDRMEHILRHGLYAILHLSGGALSDLSKLLFTGDKKRGLRDDPMLQLILEVLENEEAIHFWQHDIHKYGFEAITPLKHRLSKLFMGGKESVMLSQPDSLIDFRQIMDEGKIFLAKLSNIGADAREIVGCIFLSLFHIAALGRSDTPEHERRPFHIYVDEAHRFVTDTLEDLIAETRKFGVGLTLAHHYLSQFGNKKTDALSSVGTTVIMNVDKRDAAYLMKDLRGMVELDEMTSLKLGEAIVRIDTDIFKIKTMEKLNLPKIHFRDQIIRHSLDHYYRPLQTVKETIRQKNNQYQRDFVPPLNGPINNEKEFEYDEGF
jgi:hypothetical protein